MVHACICCYKKVAKLYYALYHAPVTVPSEAQHGGNVNIATCFFLWSALSQIITKCQRGHRHIAGPLCYIPGQSSIERYAKDRPCRVQDRARFSSYGYQVMAGILLTLMIDCIVTCVSLLYPSLIRLNRDITHFINF